MTSRYSSFFLSGINIHKLLVFPGMTGKGRLAIPKIKRKEIVPKPSQKAPSKSNAKSTNPPSSAAPTKKPNPCTISSGADLTTATSNNANVKEIGIIHHKYNQFTPNINATKTAPTPENINNNGRLNINKEVTTKGLRLRGLGRSICLPAPRVHTIPAIKPATSDHFTHK